MMPRLEFGQLYKFVVSLGFVLMAAAFVGPWAILRDQGALLVSEASLAELTPRAQDAVEAKQLHAQRILEWYPWIALAIFVLGAALSIWGLGRWWKRQKVADEREDVGLAAEKKQLEPLTPEETAQRLDEEVDEAADREVIEDALDRGSHEAAPAKSEVVTQAPSDVLEDARLTLREALRRRYEAVEAAAASALEAAFGKERRVYTDVKIMGEGGRELGRADIVAIAPAISSDPSLVFDLKLATPKNVARQTQTALLDAAHSAVALHPNAAAVALLITNNEEEKRRATPIVAGTAERLQKLLNAPSAAVVLTAEELASMPPAELSARVLAALRDPRGPGRTRFATSA